MDAVYEAQFSAAPIDFGRPDIAAMRKEVEQVLQGIKFTGIWLCSLAALYLMMAIFDYRYLTAENFDKIRDKDWSDEHSNELYNFTIEIEQLKLLHASALMCITGFIAFMACNNKVMSKTHYSNMLCLTVLIYVFYFVPVIYIAKKTYDHSEYEGQGAKMFADWTYVLIKKADLNVFGLGFAVFVHAQIFMVMIGLQFLTVALKSTIRRLETLRYNGRSNYSNQELNSILSSAIDTTVDEMEMQNTANGSI